MATLHQFQLLASTDASEREESIVGIVEALRDDEVKDADIDYTVSRMCRSLMSSSGAVRQGAAAALSQFLLTKPSFETEQMTTYFKQIIRKPKGSNRQEKRDYIFGRIFALLVLCKGGRIEEVNDKAMFGYVAEILLTSEKILMRPVCFEALCVLVEHLSYERFLSEAWPQIKAKYVTDETEGEVKDFTPEMVALALVISQRARSVGEAPPLKVFNNLLDGDHLVDLRLSLGETTHSIPSIHMVWVHIIDEFRALSSSSSNVNADVEDESDKKKKKKKSKKSKKNKNDMDIEQSVTEAGSSPVWADFWRVVIEEGFLTSTHNKKYIGLRVFEKLLDEIDESTAHHIPFLFTKNLVRILVLSASKKDTKLHKCAHHCLRVIKRVTSDSPRISFAVLSQLIGPNGDRQFDSRTRTSTVKDLLASLDPESVSEHIDFLASVFLQAKDEADVEPEAEQKNGDNGDSDDEDESTSQKNRNNTRTQSADNTRKWAINQLYSVSKLAALPLSSEARDKVIRLLVQHSFFDSVDEDVEPVSEVVRSVCKARLSSMLSDLLTPPKGDSSKDSDNAGEWPILTVHSHFDDLLKDDDLECELSLDDELIDARKTMLKTVKKIQKALSKATEATERNQYEAFAILMLHLGALQLLENDQEEATELLLDVQQCYEKAFSSKKKSKKSKKKDDDADGDDNAPHYTEVITDVLMSLLVKPSNLMRDVSTTVFKGLLPFLSPNVIDTLTAVLTKKFGGEDEEDEDDSDGEGQVFDIDAMDGLDVEALEGSEFEMGDELKEMFLARAARLKAENGGDEGDSDNDSDNESDDENEFSFVVEETQSDVENNAVDDEVQREMDASDRHLANIIRLRKEKISGIRGESFFFLLFFFFSMGPCVFLFYICRFFCMSFCCC